MGLLEDLRAAQATVDHQFLPTANELPGVVAGLALYLEHGSGYLEAAEAGGTAAVTDLIAGNGEDAGEVDREKSDKDAAEASRRATSQQTKVEHETGSGSSRGKGKS
jgi:hypothetical protein